MDYKSGELRVVPTKYEHQFWIKGAIEPHPDDNYIKNTVSFSGYFGSYGPHLFAAAPDLYTALLEARKALNCGPMNVELCAIIEEALAKAEGK